MRPLIGIICCTRGTADDPMQQVAERYLHAAPFFDADVVLVPSTPALSDLGNIVRRLDGILLTGSPSNVAPRHYRSAEAGTGPFDPARDETMLGLIAAAVRHDKPVLGICRGFQEVAVAFGSTLRRDLGEPTRALVHHAPAGVTLDELFAVRHPVSLEPDGVLALATGAERIEVNSAHYQGVAELGPDLAVEARSPDGVIEGIRPWDPATRVLAVQWHPEWQTARDAPSRAVFALYGSMLRGASMTEAAAQAGAGAAAAGRAPIGASPALSAARA